MRRLLLDFVEGSFYPKPHWNRTVGQVACGLRNEVFHRSVLCAILFGQNVPRNRGLIRHLEYVIKVSNNDISKTLSYRFLNLHVNLLCFFHIELSKTEEIQVRVDFTQKLRQRTGIMRIM